MRLSSRICRYKRMNKDAYRKLLTQNIENAYNKRKLSKENSRSFNAEDFYLKKFIKKVYYFTK